MQRLRSELVRSKSPCRTGAVTYKPCSHPEHWPYLALSREQRHWGSTGVGSNSLFFIKGQGCLRDDPLKEHKGQPLQTLEAPPLP